MKSLSLAKPLVIVTVGLPGAGKSFFGRQFSETFGAPLVSGDRLRHLLGAGSGRDSSGQHIVEQLADYQVDELFKTQKTFIVDGLAATKAERAALRKQAKDKGYNVLLVWVQTDNMTSQYRSMKRSKQKTDDKYNTPLSTEDFEHVSRRFQPPLPGEVYVVVSGKHTYATQARIVLKKLVAPRESEAKTRPIIGHENRPVGAEPDRHDHSPFATQRTYPLTERQRMAEIEDSRYGKISVRRHFRAKYVRLSVAPSGMLSISAPLYTPIGFIKRFIASSSDEIDTLLNHHGTVYSDGMEIGKSHKLHVLAAEETSVTYKKPAITVWLAPGDKLTSYGVQQQIKPLVAKALRIEAKAFLPRRVAYLAETNGFKFASVKLSHAKSRWGSCSSDRTLSLNIALMKLGFDVIDYVIIHELAHTVQLNHSKAFWQLVEQADPDYKQHRKELKQHSPHI